MVLPDAALIAGLCGLAAHGVKLETQARCAAIDRRAHTIVLDDGRQLPYDALVIAAGAIANEIPQLPAGMPGLHYLRTEADVLSPKAALRESKHCLLLGVALLAWKLQLPPPS
jgi:3-phenylpropionate/trans-cinnamate dioxygenase ferredoxin reductase subunit